MSDAEPKIFFRWDELPKKNAKIIHVNDSKFIVQDTDLNENEWSNNWTLSYSGKMSNRTNYLLKIDNRYFQPILSNEFSDFSTNKDGSDIRHRIIGVVEIIGPQIEITDNLTLIDPNYWFFEPKVKNTNQDSVQTYIKNNLSKLIEHNQYKSSKELSRSNLALMTQHLFHKATDNNNQLQLFDYENYSIFTISINGKNKVELWKATLGAIKERYPNIVNTDGTINKTAINLQAVKDALNNTLLSGAPTTIVAKSIPFISKLKKNKGIMFSFAITTIAGVTTLTLGIIELTNTLSPQDVEQFTADLSQNIQDLEQIQEIPEGACLSAKQGALIGAAAVFLLATIITFTIAKLDKTTEKTNQPLSKEQKQELASLILNAFLVEQNHQLDYRNNGHKFSDFNKAKNESIAANQRLLDFLNNIRSPSQELVDYRLELEQHIEKMRAIEPNKGSELSNILFATPNKQFVVDLIDADRTTAPGTIEKSFARRINGKDVGDRETEILNR